MEATAHHLHTYFLFPFSIDQDAVIEDHPEIWKGRQHWFGNLDRWVTECDGPFTETILRALGGWRRHSENRFDVSSPAYQDMVFFHPFVRRAFFDTGNVRRTQEALMRTYAMAPPPGQRLFYEGQDKSGHSDSIEVTELRLLLFANGISILSIGIQADDLPYSQALWINEMMRKIYPSSDRQIASARIPCRLALVLEGEGQRRTLVEEDFADSCLVGLRPKISKVLLALLYFADYELEEFDSILDERMVVNTFVCLNRVGLAPDFQSTEEYEAALSRLLYVDRAGEGFRYDPEFIAKQMDNHVYRRWQHDGTVYGMTSYSNITLTLLEASSCTREWKEASLVHRMFQSKNYLIAIIALFYRVTLLDFARESAIVSRILFPVFSGQVVRHHHIQLASRLMADFHYFNNYWFFTEITTKDEEFEHFQMLCRAYRIHEMKEEIGDDVEKLAGYIDRLYTLRNGDAVNRLALMSVIVGGGALITGFFGQNIPALLKGLEKWEFSLASYLITALLTVASIVFIFYVVSTNWADYRASLFAARRWSKRTSLRRTSRDRGPV